MNCTITDCMKNAAKRGLCAMHYRRWLRHGSPNIIKRTLNGAPLLFLEQATHYEGEDCLFWPFGRNNEGYGQVYFEKRMVSVHRVICKRINGPSPEGRPFAAHSCGNGHLGCIAPRHLRWTSPKENQADMILHGTSLRGEKSTTAVLKEPQVTDIFSRANSGESTTDLAEEFGVSWSAIYKIKTGQRWGWLTADPLSNGEKIK